MARKKKRKAAQFMSLYARDDSKSKTPAVKMAFVLSATLEEAAEWHEKDRYGLVKRGFHLCSTIKLSVVQRYNQESLPTCGCYENAAWLYLIKEEDNETHSQDTKNETHSQDTKDDS